MHGHLNVKVMCNVRHGVYNVKTIFSKYIFDSVFNPFF